MVRQVFSLDVAPLERTALGGALEHAAKNSTTRRTSQDLMERSAVGARCEVADRPEKRSG